MAFLNKKEQVLQIELTPYGRYLYSIGRFKPTFYEFYDDDIIYDKRYAEVAPDSKAEVKNLYGPEPQNEIVPRIKSAVVTDVQHNFKNLENKNVLQTHDTSEFCAPNIENIPTVLSAEQIFSEKEYSMGLPLGTSGHDNQNSPAWEVELLKGELVDFRKTTNIMNQIKIPQLEIDVNLDVYYEYDDATKEKTFYLKEKNLLIDVDEINSVDIVEDEYEIEMFLENLDSSMKKVASPPTPAKAQIIVSGTFEGTQGGAHVSGAVLGYGPSGIDAGNRINDGTFPINLKNGQEVSLSGTLISKNAFGLGFQDALKSFIRIKTKVPEGFHTREILIVPNSLGKLLDSFNLNLGKDSSDSYGYSENIIVPGVGGIGVGPIYSQDVFYWAYEGGDISDFTKNLVGAINLPSPNSSFRPFYASSVVSETGTDGSSTWSAMTGTITVETAMVGSSASSIPGFSTTKITAINVTGTSVKNENSSGTQYGHVAEFVGGTNFTISTTDDSWTEEEIKDYAGILSNVRYKTPEYEVYGNKDTFPANLKKLRNDYPWLWNEDKTTYQKFYFSKDPAAVNSEKFVDYYFDVATDSEINSNDFCNAKTFDDHKSLYVTGYIKCLPTKVENVNIYDQSDADNGEPC